MRLEQLTSRIFYYPHQPETDRPMLAYINGSRISLAIDAGNSTAHVDEFYGALAEANLKKPDITVITHWHWDHTFGMHHIHGLSAAHMKTNEMLEQERTRLEDSAYADALKEGRSPAGRRPAGWRRPPRPPWCPHPDRGRIPHSVRRSRRPDPAAGPCSRTCSSWRPRIPA